MISSEVVHGGLIVIKLWSWIIFMYYCSL